MKNQALLLTAILTVGILIQAQELDISYTSLEVSKTANKKGMYVNTTLTEDGKIRSYISYDLKKGALGFDVLTVDANGKNPSLSSENSNNETAIKYNITIPDPNAVQNPADGINVLRLVSSVGVIGKLKIQEGHFEPKYATSVEYGEYITTYTPVFRGFKFKEENSVESEMKLNIFGANCKDGDDLEKSYAILEGLVDNTVGYFNKEATFAFFGKDARFDKDSPNGSNVLVSGQFHGPSESFKNIKEHVFDYNIGSVTKSYDGKGNRAFLMSTLNAPSSIKAWDKYQAKGKNYMTFVTMDTEGKVLDNLTFQSKSVRGNFGIFGAKDANFVFGSVNEKHEGYYRFDVGSPSHFQIVKIENGAVSKTEITSVDDLASLAVLPGGKKAKLKFKDISFSDFFEGENGDIFAIAQASADYIAIQVSKEAKVKKVYVVEKVGGTHFSTDFFESNGYLFLLFKFQNGAISQGLKKSISRGAGYMKNTNFSRVDELMTYARIVKIDPEKMSCSKSEDIFPTVILGRDNMFKGPDGELILPVRDEKRKYKMAIIE